MRLNSTAIAYTEGGRCLAYIHEALTCPCHRAMAHQSRRKPGRDWPFRFLRDPLHHASCRVGLVDVDDPVRLHLGGHVPGLLLLLLRRGARIVDRGILNRRQNVLPNLVRVPLLQLPKAPVHFRIHRRRRGERRYRFPGVRHRSPPSRLSSVVKLSAAGCDVPR